jgi:hypothetical protein
MLALAGLFCSRNLNVAGGTDTETGGTSISGKIALTGNGPAVRTVVRLFPAGYNPLTSPALPDSFTDTTDGLGAFAFNNVYPGIYNIVALDSADRNRAAAYNIQVVENTRAVSNAVLAVPGAIRVRMLMPFDTVNGCVFIPGTNFVGAARSGADTIILDSVPAGVVPSIWYTVRNFHAVSQLIAENVTVPSGGSVAVDFSSWKFSKRLYLNTTATGAGVSETETGFPVLIRLTSGNFSFAQALDSGQDLRFANKNGAFLSYQIERWDKAGQVAEIWVKADTVYGNDSTHYITMSWGNPNAGAASNGPAVFDTGNGFQAVFHMSEPGNSTIYDATANHFYGTPIAMSANATVAGPIGNCKEFNGSSGYYILPLTAHSSLNFPQNGIYTFSAWAYVDTIIPGAGDVIVSKGDWQYNFEIDRDGNGWHMSEWEDKAGLQRIRAPAVARVWKYFVGVRSGNSMSLYLDGQFATDSTFFGAFANLARDTTYDVTIGKIANQNNRFFDGKLDEIRISNVILSANWIKLCYMNQKQTDVLIEFR